jgi:hypothetical protein
MNDYEVEIIIKTKKVSITLKKGEKKYSEAYNKEINLMQKVGF